MTLLSVNDLPGAAITPEQALARAEALVAAAICPALPGLGVQTWELNYRLRDEPRAYGNPLYGRRRLGPEVLKHWPITGLVSVTQNDIDLTGDCTFDAFSIRKDALTPEFYSLGELRVVFRTGWTADALPEGIRQAVALTAQDTLSRPAGLKSERLGDVQNVYTDAPVGGGLPPAAQALLSAWRYPGV